jgi:hypothetical protein
MWSSVLADVDPFIIQWPPQWLEDPEIRPVIDYLNRFLHDLWIRTGGGIDVVDPVPPPLTSAQLITLQQQLGSGDPLTWDETGFTWDSTKLSFDQTEA